MWWSRRHRPARTAALVVLLAAATGCGFHLRGNVTYPPAMAVTHLEAKDRFTPFYRLLRESLARGGLRLTENATEAGAVIRILDDESDQRVLSVSARNVPVEYQVYYIVRYAVDLRGRPGIEPQELTRTREYNYDETEVLGKESEASGIRDALAADLVGVVTRRLSALR